MCARTEAQIYMRNIPVRIKIHFFFIRSPFSLKVTAFAVINADIRHIIRFNWRQENYGLKTPAMKLSVTAKDGREYVYEIGLKVPKENKGYYSKSNAGDTVYCLNKKYSKRQIRSTTKWRESKCDNGRPESRYCDGKNGNYFRRTGKSTFSLSETRLASKSLPLRLLPPIPLRRYPLKRMGKRYGLWNAVKRIGKWRKMIRFR